MDTLYPASGALSTFLLSGFIPSNCVPLSLTFYTTNGLLRRYFPKRTDFQLVSQETVNEVVIRLNSTPRKVLGYQTPLEVFAAQMC